MECNTGDFLYVESRDNYASVCYLNKDKKKGVMLRSSLTRLEEQIPVTWIMRCQRSYIVNLEMVEQVEGNAQGYKFKLHSGDVIPVSRSRHKKVLQVLYGDRL